MEEEEKLLEYLQLYERVEDLYLINAYYLMRNLQNEDWKVDWKTLMLPFVLLEKSSIADLLKRWPFLRHYKDVSPRLPPLQQFDIIHEEPGPKNSKILYTTKKGRFVAAFLFYLLTYENNDFFQFNFLEKNLFDLPGFNAPEDFFESLKILKSQVPALAEYIPLIQEKIVELNWKIDYKVLLIPLYLLDTMGQSYTDLIQNYPQFGYYRELKQRVQPLISLGIISEQRAGRRGSLLQMTKKGRYFLTFFGYMLNFPNKPS